MENMDTSKKNINDDENGQKMSTQPFRKRKFYIDSRISTQQQTIISEKIIALGGVCYSIY